MRSDKFAFKIFLTSFSLKSLCLFSTLPIINATMFGFWGSMFNIVSTNRSVPFSGRILPTQATPKSPPYSRFFQAWFLSNAGEKLSVDTPWGTTEWTLSINCAASFDVAITRSIFEINQRG